MLTERIALSYVNYEKSAYQQVLVEFFGPSEEDESLDAQVSVTVSYNPGSGEYDRCNTVDDLDSDDDQDDDDRQICIDLAKAFIHAMNQLNPPDIEPR